jgi:hypothetical protein
MTRTSAQWGQTRRRIVQKNRYRGLTRGPQPFLLEHSGLAQGEGFQGGVTPTTEEGANYRREGHDEFERELQLLAWRHPKGQTTSDRNSLISDRYKVLTPHK